MTVSGSGISNGAKKIAVASGKGGTGKTTFSLMLSRVLSEKFKVHLVDCDVEEPNCHLFLNYEGGPDRKEISVFTPEIDLSKCTFCGRCQQVCKYGALLMLNKKFLKFDELCHPCRGCMLACPEKAISEGKRAVGLMYSGPTAEKPYFTYSEMNVGEARSIPLISELKKNLKEPSDYIVLDSPPGASCAVVEILKTADYAVLVTEPTPFGLFDLKIALEVVKKLGIPSGIVINRSDGDDAIIEDFARGEGVEIICRIPFSLDFAKNYAEGKLDISVFPGLSEKLEAFF